MMFMFGCGNNARLLAYAGHASRVEDFLTSFCFGIERLHESNIPVPMDMPDRSG